MNIQVKNNNCYKGMAINVSFFLMLMLVMLIIVFLFAGVFKDFAFGQSGRFGLVPGSATLTITDANTEKKVTVECRRAGADYAYTIKINQLGFSYPSKVKVFPIFLFKSRIASTQSEEEVEIPGRLSFDSIEMTSKIPPAPIATPSPPATPSTPTENVVIGFFKQNEKCLQMAKDPKTSFDNFVKECAKSLETEASVVAKLTGCS